MSMPKDDSQREYADAWRTYLDGLEKALQNLEAQIKEASEMVETCTDEWCQATYHYVDDLSNALFTIHEPRWANPEDSARIKELKRRVRDIYADYRNVSSKVSA